MQRVLPVGVTENINNFRQTLWQFRDYIKMIYSTRVFTWST